MVWENMSAVCMQVVAMPEDERVRPAFSMLGPLCVVRTPLCVCAAQSTPPATCPSPLLLPTACDKQHLLTAYAPERRTTPKRRRPYRRQTSWDLMGAAPRYVAAGGAAARLPIAAQWAIANVRSMDGSFWVPNAAECGNKSVNKASG